MFASPRVDQHADGIYCEGHAFERGYLAGAITKNQQPPTTTRQEQATAVATAGVVEAVVLKATAELMVELATSQARLLGSDEMIVVLKGIAVDTAKVYGDFAQQIST